MACWAAFRRLFVKGITLSCRLFTGVGAEKWGRKERGSKCEKMKMTSNDGDVGKLK